MRSPSPRYTFLGFQVLALMDQGEQWSYDEAMDALEDGGNVLGALDERFGSAIDLSLYGQEERIEIHEHFAGLANAVDSRRKFGVENSGLALIVAYCFELIQRELRE